MDPSTSKNSGVSKQSGLASKNPGFCIHDNALLSRTDPRSPYFNHLTSPFAARNASSSRSHFTSNGFPTFADHTTASSSRSHFTCNGFPTFADHNTASSSIWNAQPNHFNYLTGNGLPPLPAKDKKMKQPCQSTLLACNGLNNLLLGDEARSSAQKKQAPSKFTFIPRDGLESISVKHNASPSGPPKKQPSFLSFLSKTLSYANKSVLKAQEPPMLEFLPPKPSFDPDARYDLRKPILPDSCSRCHRGFNHGKDGGIFMYNDKAYCSLKCRQKQIDFDNPPVMESRAPPPVVMTASGNKKRKTTAAPQGHKDNCTFSLF